MTEQEWLNNNDLSLKIWHNKYQNDGESFEEWLDRVSNKDENIKRLIREKKFLFGGRTLSNRNTDKGSLSNCFTKDALVNTLRGIIPIKDVIIGDYVLSDDGEYHKVNDIMQRNYTGDLYKISSNEIYKDIVCTPNHQFLTNHGWKRADRIFPQGVTYTNKGGDKLKTAFAKHNPFSNKYENTKLDFSENFSNTNNKKIDFLENDKIVISNYKNTSRIKDKPVYTWINGHNPINRYVILDSDFCYFIGRWLGDGSITKRKGCQNPSILQIVFNATTEKDAAQRCQEIGEKIFGIKASIKTTNQNVIAVRFENEIISTWFLNNFGEKCDGKYIPDEYLGNINVLSGLLDADGSVDTHGAIKIVLKNYALIKWIKDTCYLNNINTSKIKDIGNRQPNTFELNISVSQSNGRLHKYLHKNYFDKRLNKTNVSNCEYTIPRKIEILENQSTTVYNLSVEDTHTYNVNGVIVHNCYSIGYVPDSLEGILDVNTKIALTFKAQGGQGLSLTKIRPKGMLIGGKFQSDGIVPFMEIFNTTTSSISQGGSRKGALMMSIDVWHKEAETFIKIKEDFNKINKANLSVEIDDAFMDAVKNNIDTDVLVHREYNGQEIEYTVNPVKRFKMICESAKKCAEPGIIFTNRFRNYNLMELIDSYQIETSNPCGEQPLAKNSACNLSSINLSEYVIAPFTEQAVLNFKELHKDMKYIVRAMDDVLEENIKNHALQEQKEMSLKFRNVGIGIMGWHDALIKMGIVYGSQKAIQLTAKVMNELFRYALEASVELGEERGNFPGYSSKVWDSEFIKYNLYPEEIARYKKRDHLRNCSLLSIAPTGSIGTLLNISTGVEPWFSLHYTRHTKSLEGDKDVSFEVWAPIAEEANKRNWHPETLITSESINYKDRIKMQAAFQNSCDTAISSTVNLPSTVTVEDVENLYMYAWEMGLKGITIYVAGSRDPILETSTKKEEPIKEDPKELSRGFIVKAGDNCIGLKRTLITGCGTLHCEAFFDPHTGDLLETYLSKGSKGGCNNFMIGLSRMISLSARGGIKLENILDQLKSCGTCPSYAVRAATKKDTSTGSCCPVAVGNALKEMHIEVLDRINRCVEPHVPIKIEEATIEEIQYEECPECHHKTLIHNSGCIQCTDCGWSKCN